MSKASENENIVVVTRLRPMNTKEKNENRKPIVNIDPAVRQVAIQNPDNPEDLKSFTFDGAYREDTQQKLFYEESCFGIIECALEGFNSTIFAYGQTGCGKSYTMQGPSTTDEESRGVIPNSFSHIFQHIKASKDIEFLIRCTYLELYNEEVKDLLCSSKSTVKCDIKEDPGKGVFVKGLTDVVVENEEDLHAMLDKGLTNRTVASTNMNAESSRSHSIFTVIIEMNFKDPESGKDMLKCGKLNLVDLAGSERQKKTGAKDATLKEGIKINMSLSALGNVISSLAEGTKHIPYRDSKLTRLLQDSLGGNSKTMMIAAISPADYNFEETLSTLRYANRAKNIKNKPKINEDPKDTIIREFKEEITRLRSLLQAQNGSGGGGMSDTVLAAMASADTFASAAPTPAAPAVASMVTDDSSNKTDTEKDASPRAFLDSPAPTALSPTKESEYEDDFNERSNTEEEMQMAAVHDKLRAKEVEVEEEKRAREEMAIRLQQLEHMLVTNENHVRSSPTKTNPDGGMSEKIILEKHSAVSEKGEGVFDAESAERERQRELEDEEAMRIYHERVLKARQHKEQLQQQELQRVLDEKKAMEDELEMLRDSATGHPLENLGSSVEKLSTGDAGADVVDSAVVAKTVKKVKKKYEKKLMVLEDELTDMRDEFSYQRRQLMDALVEGEKDSKLYEQICRSLLSEKDMKKILDKARYDEDSEEWIVPYTKRKSLGEGGIPVLKSSTSSAPHTHGGSGLGAGGILPDINMAQQALLQAKHTSCSEPSSARSKDYRDSYNSKHTSSNNHKLKQSHANVPLLTLLPGGLTIASSVIASQRSNGSDTNRHRERQVSTRSDNKPQEYDSNYDGVGYDDTDVKKKKTKSNHKNKLPKSIVPTGNGVLPSGRKENYDKLPSARKNSSDNLPDEAGGGEEAGPFTDWGFSNEYLSRADNKPENEYSEDEEFEAVHDDDADIATMKLGNNGPYPPSYEAKLSSNGSHHRKNNAGKTKKKKQRKSFDEEGDESDYAPSKQQSPRFGALPSLPPI